MLGQNYGVPDDIDEDDLMGELDALEADMTLETEHEAATPAYLQVQAPPLVQAPTPWCSVDGLATEEC